MDLEALVKWRDEETNLPPMLFDYHRLQVEYFVWRYTHSLLANVRFLEIGVEYKKPYLNESLYYSLNYDNPQKADWNPNWTLPKVDKPDIIGDCLALPIQDNSLDYVICTEVLEHVANPWDAMGEIYRIVKPGGVALLTSPFLWPYHGTQRYADYWRMTADGWRVLCRGFTAVKVIPFAFRDDSPLDDLAAKELMGEGSDVRFHTGYGVYAIK